MNTKQLALPVVATALVAAASAQITVRDTIVALPPISFCMDGATHVTVCTNHRLRPAGFGNLGGYVGLPLEIVGTPGAITCSYLDVQSVAVLGNEQYATTARAATTMSVSFFGAGAIGDVYLLFLAPGLAAAPVLYPFFQGPVHVDPASTVFLGIFVPPGTSAPYQTLTFPLNPAAFGIPLFDQALVIHASGALETSVVDTFQF